MNTLVASKDESLISNISSSPRIFNRIHFKRAENKSELEQAFRLVANCYFEKGYITQSDSQLRIKLQHALPESAVFVGELGDRVVATSSVFPDSPIGLPADSIFQSELDELRSKGRKITELGSLASNLEVETSPLHIPLHILQSMRLVYLYGQDYLKADDLIITVNPKHRIFYEKVLLFEPMSEIKFYPEVNQAPAIVMRQNLHTIEARLLALSGQKSRLKTLRDLFFGGKIVNLDFLNLNQSLNIWNTDLINYFFYEKSSVFQQASPEILREIQLKHNQHSYPYVSKRN